MSDACVTFPLSAAQRRLWFLEQLNAGSALYNTGRIIELDGELDHDALGRALDALAARHESLRTTFSEIEGEAVQTIAPTGALPLRFADLHELPSAARDTEADALCRAELDRPFDLAGGPLVRALLLRLDDERHRLVVTLHHIITDGWSNEILVRDLAGLYEAAATGRPPELPELAIQYVDYSEWQRSQSGSADWTDDLAYWLERLTGAPDQIDLATDRPRAARTGAGAVVSLRLDPDLERRVDALCQREGATLFMALLAAFSAVLRVYTGRDDLLIGSASANRDRAELEHVVGFFVNTLALRTTVSGDPTLGELLGRVRSVTLDALAHQSLPFDDLVAELRPSRSVGLSPLFQAMCVVEEGSRQEIALPALRLRSRPAENDLAKFDLTLAARRSDEGLELRLGYASDLFDAARMQSMLGHVRNALAALASDPRTRLSDCSVLSREEERQLLVEWNGCSSPQPSGAAHELFEAQAARRAKAEAVCAGGRSMTYGALNAEANRLARRLRAHGVQRGTRVGLYLDRSIELVVAILGILKAGGAYVPLERTLPASRLAFMVRDASLPLVLTRSALQPAFEALTAEGTDGSGGAPAQVLCLDAIEADAASEDGTNLGIAVSGDDLAYVIYTSGSTGQPKATEVPHRAIPGFVLDVDYVKFDATQTLLQYSSISWDALTLELWPALLTGGTCAIVADRIVRAPELRRAIADHKVTTLWMTASLFNAVVDEDIEALAGLKQLLVGGEALSAGHVRRVVERYPALRVVNGYGPSECTVFTTCHVITSASLGEDCAVPIGRPIGDRRVLVLDRDARLVPAGVVGEVYVGGAAVAHGYGRRPALTAERFVPDPYAEDGGRLYRTGDLARWRRDGTLDFIGRADDQVKIRGFRVELGEVETALRACRGVREAVVVASAEVAGPGRRLVGYVVGESDWSLEAVTAELATRVPAYMMPTAWVPIAKLPLNANGKVDRAALPAPSTARSDLEGTTRPRDPVEAAIAEIWRDVLGATGIGVHDDFFALGGHSLTAGRVLARMRASLGVDLPLRALFEAPTVAGLAARVAATQPAAHAAATPVVAVDRTQAQPLSFAQERLWFLHQLAPHAPVYNVFRCLALRGPLAFEALEASWRDLVKRHEALRTRFPRLDGRPVQIVDAEVSAPPAIVDLTRMPAARRDTEARLLADVESRRPFDLGSGPLARATLIRQGTNDHLLFIALHHIICDGWSLDVLLRDWAELYAARCDGREAPLPQLQLQPVDFAHWQREHLQGAALEEPLDYWKERLSGAPPLLTLPWDKPRPAVQTFEGRHLWRELPSDLAERLRTSASAAGVTLFVYMLAAFDALLLRYSGQRAPVVGTPVSDRGRVESEGLVGFFVDTLVLRTDVSGDPTFAALLERVRATVLEAHENAVPFEKLIEALQPARDLSSSPLFQVMFVLQSLAPAAKRFADLEVEERGAEATTSKFDLTVLVDATSDQLRVLFEYNSNLFEAATVERFAADFQALLESAVISPGAHLSELRLTANADAHERRALEGAPTEAAPVHRDFEAFAARQPGALAVTCEDERVSYRDLNARANRLARRLRAMGVAAETPVGVYLERSVDLIVAFWAVLKAGGVYLPLDPAYPAERIAFVVRDAGAAVVLTHRGLRASLPNTEARILDLDAERAPLERECADDLAVDPLPDSLAYVIYTSGSTGRPKGAQLTHGGLSNLVRAQAAAFGLAAADRVLQFSSPSFDASIFEIVLALLAGGVLVLARRERLVPGLELVELLREHAVTTVVMPPSVVAAVPEGHALPALRLLIVAGEACPPDLVARWSAGRRFFNAYGPTETTVWATVAECAADGCAPPIGRAIENLRAHVLDRDLGLAPVGVAGELCVGGIALARGYAARPDLTAERFVPDPFAAEPGARVYRTGDRVRLRADGQLEFLGRLDNQIKLRGFRIELHEIEAVMREHPGVREAAVAAKARAAGNRRLVAYVVPRGAAAGVSGLAEFVRGKLPEHMVPAAFVELETLPLTPNGKLDRDALPDADASIDADRVAAPPSGALERTIADAWCRVLGLPGVGVNDSFFALGGHSLLVAQLQEQLQRALGRSLSIVELFQYPTVRALADHLGASEAPRRDEMPAPREARADANRGADAIAVVGMACRVPGAADVAAFWRNVCDGVESITSFSDDDLAKAGVDARARTDSNYVKAGGVLADVDLFDASFFGFTPRDAERTDPQHRLLIECAWEALEHAGCVGSRRDARVGVFAGSGTSGYFDGVLHGPDRALGSAADFLATRVSHRLDLRGPSFTVQTACSTSLVAIHLACRSLVDRECDVALAGGVSIRLPQTRGYAYQEGGILSPDGHCRAFDARAAGTVGGNGLGLVALKRLDDALADGDTIYAVVRGSAVNNDGADKVGFTAPSVTAQAEVIADALRRARVDAESIAYVEAHGTGTAVGDPIEIAALTQAFRATTSATEFCALGTVKSNIGHLDAAAGVAGFIKAALAVYHSAIPPTLHFDSPNPRIDFPSSPFFVNTRLRPWTHEAPRRAGVSSFGMGGTNVHVVLEQAPAPMPTSPAPAPYLLTLSARTPDALAAARQRLASHLRAHPDLDIADVASTLQIGRTAFAHREAIFCSDTQHALEALERPASEPARTQARSASKPAVVFVFPGQGSQHVNMARDLYETEPRFRAVVDECCETLRPELGFDLRAALWPDPEGVEMGARRLDETAVTQPALFVIEYALARLWMDWGVEPAALIGHSVGELVAACLAGVFTLDDALRLVAARGALMQALPGGAMLAVLRPEGEVAAWLGPELAIAAVNAPDRTVVAGPADRIDALERRLVALDVPCRRLRTSHAFHSAHMDPALDAFAARVADVDRRAPRIPIVSNVTGDWLTAAEATSPAYWRRHLRATVRFADAVARAAARASAIFLEVGPGRIVERALARRHASTVLSSLAKPRDAGGDRAILIAALGGLWTAGVDINWQNVHAGERRRRVPLPTYPFERRSYWIAAAAAPAETTATHHAATPPPSAPSSEVRQTYDAEASAEGVHEDDDLVRAIRVQLALMEEQLALLQTSG